MARDPGTAENPCGRRQPSAHEQRAGESWDASYIEGPAPWDIGRAQPAVVRLASEGAFTGAVLDAGCGTGDNALHIAKLGIPVLGFDVAPTALNIARERSTERGLDAKFMLLDALRLNRLGRVFQTVLDCALFHALEGDERRDYVQSLATVTERGGHLHLLCFADARSDAGPHPVTQKELRAAFTRRSGWDVASIDSDRLLSRFALQGAPAWRAKLERV